MRKNNDNKLINLLKESYIKHGITPKISDMKGGIEHTYWVLCNPKINTACIGPKIDDAHTKNETLYIDTIQPVLDVIIDIFKIMGR